MSEQLSQKQIQALIPSFTTSVLNKAPLVDEPFKTLELIENLCLFVLNPKHLSFDVSLHSVVTHATAMRFVKNNPFNFSHARLLVNEFYGELR